MKIEQFKDKALAHYSYAILSECKRKIVVIDPSRDLQPYYNFALQHEAEIIAVIETHPHADFISGHLELFKTTGATIYSSKLLDADYPHEIFDDGNILTVGKIKLKALNTPGHSPDSISIVLEHQGKDKAVFTGDTLFIGDCGRPDLREESGSLTAERKKLAQQMYHSLRYKLMTLDNEVLVYPAHGAGTLCGKALSEANQSTIGAEKQKNWSLQEMPENKFVEALISDLPFIPKYFPYDVDLNKKGAPDLSTAMNNVIVGSDISTSKGASRLEPNIIIVDTRPSEQFKGNHLSNSINLMNGEKFETWLGSIIPPHEPFYLAGENKKTLTDLIKRAAKIGYDPFIKEAFVLNFGVVSSDKLDINAFKEDPDAYTIVDVRNASEVQEQSVFENSINIPLPELRDRISEIPKERSVVVHCAGGYRSAAGSSIIENQLPIKVFDLGKNVKDFQ
jgi:hydroxyacylglutathione hydrolase